MTLPANKTRCGKCNKWRGGKRRASRKNLAKMEEARTLASYATSSSGNGGDGKKRRKKKKKSKKEKSRGLGAGGASSRKGEEEDTLFPLDGAGGESSVRFPPVDYSFPPSSPK